MKKFWIILLTIGTIATACAFTNKDLDIFNNSPIPIAYTYCPEITSTANIKSVSSINLPPCFILDCEELNQPTFIDYKAFANSDGDFYIMCETMPLGSEYASPVNVYVDGELYRSFKLGEETQTGGIFKGPKNEICWNYFGKITLKKGWHRVKFEIKKKNPKGKYYQGFSQMCLYNNNQSNEKWTITPYYKDENTEFIPPVGEYMVFSQPPFKVLSPVSEEYLLTKDAKIFNAVFDVIDWNGKIRDRFICPVNFQKKDNDEILIWISYGIYVPNNRLPNGEYSIVCKNIQREEKKPFT